MLCRLCMSDEKNEYLEYSNCGKATMLLTQEKVRCIFGEKLAEYPIDETMFICYKCSKIIDEFYCFYLQVIENNKIVYNSIIEDLHAIEDVKSIKCSKDQIWNDRDTKNITQSELNKDGCKANKVSEDGHQVEDRLLEDYFEIASCEEVCTTLEDRNSYLIEQNILVDIPDHLKLRTTKKKGDEKIKQFIGLSCTICDRKNINFNTFKEMQIHYETKHNTRGYIMCCNRKIYRKDRAVDHITNHINPEAFKCPKCGQKCKSKILLKIHLKQHLPVEERRFKCDECDQRFVLRSQLTNHKVSHLNNDEKKFICDECGKAFAFKFVLVKHLLTHSNEKTYFCEICAKEFTCKNNLASHMERHRPENDELQQRVKCDDCGQWYKNIQTLRTHLQKHRDKREHICQSCNKRCTTKNSLSAHIRYVHNKVTKFECRICQRKFRRKLELTEHTARHTGEVLYSCPFCPKTFYSSSNFFTHRKNKHPEEFANILQNVEKIKINFS